MFEAIYARSDRAVAPNPGTDAVPVLRHLTRARTIDIVQQAILAVILLFLICTPVVFRFGLIIGLAVWAMVGIPVLLAEARSSNPSGTISVAAVTKVNWGKVVAFGLTILAVMFLIRQFLPDLISEAIFGAPSLDGGTAAQEGDRGGSAAVVVENPPGLGPGLGSVFLWLTILAAVTGICGAVRARGLMSIPGELEPAGTDDRRAHFIGLAQRSPVVTYHSSRAPFVGSGFPLATWQLAMTLRPADASADGGSAMTIDSVGLNRTVKARIGALGADSAITRMLPGLELSDHVYVSGRDTVAPVFHPHELRQSGYPFATIEQVQADPTTPVRAYLRCTIDSWGGELVTTVFLHCALQGETLYVEFSSCVLPPTPQRYHVFGGVNSTGGAMFLGFMRGVAAMPIEFIRSPVDTVREIARSTSSASTGGSHLGAGDHGAVAGIRELGTDLHEQNYFQYRDSVKYVEILERQILDALLDYLRENNVDVSELDERANAIVNNGVINYGKMQTGAAGAGSSAKVGSIGDNSRGSAG
ncbi:MAG TPA: hypothetical protein VGE61_06050 [Glycomyces sp.]